VLIRVPCAPSDRARVDVFVANLCAAISAQAFPQLGDAGLDLVVAQELINALISKTLTVLRKPGTVSTEGTCGEVGKGDSFE
jgi:hypothetical protein